MDIAQFSILLLNLGLFGAILLLAITISSLLVECVFAVLPDRQSNLTEDDTQNYQPTIAILVPAHNEADGIQNLLTNLASQIIEGDRVIVIADNCTDRTAEIAKEYGVEVIERKNRQLRGKGFALDHGMKFLESDPPDVVIILDADCIVRKGSIHKLSRMAFLTGNPVQALYLIELPEHPKFKDFVSTLAFTVKNLVRPIGLKRLNLPCFLTGTGMAFSWSTINKVSLANDNLVEDMQLSIDLAIAGHPTMLCPDVKVVGRENVTKNQRTRWEHGHLKTLLSQVPRLIKASISKKRLDLLTLSLDLAVPPLSLLVVLWGVAITISMICLPMGVNGLIPYVLAIEGLMIFCSILIAWIKFGYKNLPLRLLIAIPFYLLWKIPLYFAFLIRPQTEWIRTDRKGDTTDIRTVNDSKARI
ncbi:MAG: glycosyltransferase family 2 protein [Cyanobacteria bacterium P01_G01_bin.67]